MTRQPANGPGNWVLLSYRMPREPSTPRITIWRKLKRLGVAQLGDGLIALPADARTREHLDWIAEEIVESGGTAAVWHAQPATPPPAPLPPPPPTAPRPPSPGNPRLRPRPSRLPGDHPVKWATRANIHI